MDFILIVIMTPLHNRFSVSIGPLNHLLKLIGINTVSNSPPFSCSSIRTCWLVNLWTFFCIFLNLQINLHTFIKEATGPLKALFVKQHELSNRILTEKFNLIFLRLSSLIFHVSIHFLLVAIIRSAFRDFIGALELLYTRLNRPSFTSIRKLSVYSVVWILFTVCSF